MYRNKLLLILFALFVAQTNAQEILIPLTANPVQKTHSQIKKSGTSIELPFFDDFSNGSNAPDQTKWEDAYAYVNNSYANDTISIGVASFDALDNNGAIYETIGYYNTYEADHLTSKPINLEGKTDVILSFYYQGGGNGPAPSATDVLELQFYAQAADEWIPVWYAPGQLHEKFQEAFVAVDQPRFLTDGFRFRFVNYVSLGKDEKPTERGNADVWNLDFVYLNDNRTDGVWGLQDMFFTHTFTSFLNNYESMPWTHYKAMANPESLMFEDLSVSIKNFGTEKKLLNDLYFDFVDVWGTTADKSISAGSRNMTEQELWEPTFSNNFYTKFVSSQKDSALFEIRATMRIDETDFYETNNQMSYYQVFKDYYAYDDGTAEIGYGIIGNASASAQVAYHFTNEKPDDKLWAVDMFITRTLNKANLKYFYLTVWKENAEGLPGEIIYQQPLAETLAYTDGLNQFSTFRLHEQESESTDTAVVVGSSFFVGWEQTVEGMLGIGLDRNRQAKDKLFCNLSNTWTPSIHDGALMVRPVFRQRERLVTGVEHKIEQIQPYPNPASDFIRIDLPQAHNALLQLWDLSGKLRKNQKLQMQSERVDVTDLPEGVYLLRVTAGDKLVSTGKVLIRR